MHCFKRDRASLVFRLSIKRSHIVKSVCKLYKYNADVLRHCKKHLAKAFHVSVFFVFYAYLNELGQSVDKLCDLISEFLLYFLKIDLV